MSHSVKIDTRTLRVVPLEELALHNKKGDLWVSVRGMVIDVSNFKHQGGEAVLLKAGLFLLFIIVRFF
jgi:cytochrome b involved in lipid metabolism